MQAPGATIQVEDITLREGQQAAEIAFTRGAELEVARLVDELGVTTIQVGFAGRDDGLVEEVARLRPKAGLAMILVGFGDDWQRVVDNAAALGVTELQVLYRAADRQLEAMGLTRNEVADGVATRTGYASERVEHVTFTPSFGTSADREFLASLYGIAVDAGAERVSVIDTLGIASPETIRELVALAREAAGPGVGIDVHCHDDLGLAVANTIAGVLAGADRVDASVNGYGERAGNCPLEEVVLALELLYGYETAIRTEGLTATSRAVAELARTTVPAMKAVVGEDAFAQKLDIHLQLTARDPSLMEPYDPALVGNSRKLRLGVGTGRQGVLAKLRELGLPTVEPHVADAIAAKVNESARSVEAIISDLTFTRLVAEAGALPASA